MKKLTGIIGLMRTVIKYAPIITVIVSAITMVTDAIQELNESGQINEN